MNSQFDWSLVPSFLAVLHQGSLLGASRQLKASQPTVGRHVAELERQLGVVLFERTGRGLAPTQTALRLAEAARAMEAGAQQIARQMGAEQSIAGSVRISASQPVACYLLPPILADMRKALPEVQVELVVTNQISNLLRREADIAVRMVEPQQGSLVARRIGKVTIQACAHQDYVRRRGMPRQPADLLSHDLIGGDQDQEVIKGFAALGHVLAREDFAFRTDDLVAGWQAVRAGLGVGFAASYLTRSDREVVPLLPGLKIPPRPVWLAVHREIRGNPRIRAAFNFLAESMPPYL